MSRPTRRPWAQAPPPTKRTHFWSDTSAVTESIGTTLLVGILFVTTATVSGLIMAQTPEEVINADFLLILDNGNGVWSDTDDRILIAHNGGEGLRDDMVRFLITIDGTRSLHEGNDLHYPDGPFADGAMRVGEQWALTGALDIGTVVSVDVTTRSQSQSSTTQGGLVQRTAWSATATATAPSCVRDDTAPWDRDWVLMPSDVTSGTSGMLRARVTFVDDCAGVDPASLPVLQYRIPAGTVPDWTNMEALTAVPDLRDTWEAKIPEPDGNWSGAAGKVLEHRASLVPADLKGNILGGAGGTQTEAIEDLLAPSAHFTVLCDDHDCSFDATLSTASGGRTIATYTWTFGDGGSTTSTLPTTDHTYLPGSYTVRLTVTDSQGSTATQETSLTVATDLHVHDIDHKKKGASKAEIHLLIHDSSEAPVGGATVTATTCKSGSTCLSQTGTTDAAGSIRFTYGPPGGGGGSYTTCIDTVSLTGMVYDRDDDDVAGLFRDTNGKTCYTEAI